MSLVPAGTSHLCSQCTYILDIVHAKPGAIAEGIGRRWERHDEAYDSRTSADSLFGIRRSQPPVHDRSERYHGASSQSALVHIFEHTDRRVNNASSAI